jgi:hypothetical protein
MTFPVTPFSIFTIPPRIRTTNGITFGIFPLLMSHSAAQQRRESTVIKNMTPPLNVFGLYPLDF